MFDMTLVLASFGGGLFAASLGVIGCFSLCGVMVLLGVAASMAGSDTILNMIAFGPYFGPHISFAAAVAAAAYAGRIGLINGGTDLLVPLNKLKRWDVLCIGGVFGVIGYGLNELIIFSGFPIDTIALTVVISNLAVRIIFKQSGFLGKDRTKINVKPGVKSLPFTLLTGFSLGLVSAFASEITGSAVIGYGIAAASLLFLFHGDFPVSHHVAICAAYASMAVGNIWIGGLFGALSLLLGNFIGSLFNTEAETYFDPPAASIAILSAVVFIFL